MSGDEFDFAAAWYYLSGYLSGSTLVDDDELAQAFAAAVAHGARLY